MTIGKLLLYIGIAAFILTLFVVLVLRKDKRIWMTYLQNFCGALFLFSGAVKAVDPLGTAYKMEQYFVEFQGLFEATSIGFIAPLFPWLSSFSAGFSVFMIVLEMVLGIMLIVGAKPKLTAWAFSLLVLFFLFLTGFTYLTGYVPSEANFFEFGKWTAFQESNMKVTDCGCFGDFIKLKPKTSFLKDIFLLIPAILFILFHSKFHQLFTARIGTWLTALFGFSVLLYCLSNYVWNIPDVDFRPFRNGVNIAEQKAAEEEAEANVDILGWVFKHKESGEVKTIMEADFVKARADYPKDIWETVDQVRSKPAIAYSKISEFSASDIEGNDVTEEILHAPGMSFMIVAYKLYGDGQVEKERTVLDSLMISDTVKVNDTGKLLIVENLDTVVAWQEKYADYLWEDTYLERYTNVMNPVLDRAAKAGHQVYALTAYASAEVIDDFSSDANCNYAFYTADDILLKTIVRSNPGLVVLRDGKIVGKFHYKDLPSFDEIMAID